MLKKHAFLLSALTSTMALGGELTVATDLLQPILLGGWNLNSYYYFDNNLLVGWSHGEDLRIDADDEFATDPLVDQNVNTFTDWSTGPEIGYRLGKFTDIRLDLKAHKTFLEFKDNGEKVDYTVFTAGPSFFYNWYPTSNEVDGLVVQLSARYWFNVGNDLDGGEFNYRDSAGNQQKHNPDEFWDGSLGGFGANIAVGYTF